jgi:uncharacterized protein YbjT (DUF2867 family)
MKIAIIAGSTGLVGNALQTQLILDDNFASVISLVRTKTNSNHQKAQTVIVNFNNISDSCAAIVATHAYCCLGTTIKKAGSKDAQYKIDHDYVIAFANQCKQLGVESFSVVSSIGADSKTKNFYLMTKGNMEDDLSKIGFHSLHIFRPSLLLGNRNEFRLGEKIATLCMKIVSPLFVGSLKKYKGIKAETVAKAMIHFSNLSDKGIFVHENNELLDLR